MITLCCICKKELDMQIDRYISLLEEDGGFKNDESNLRAHFECREKL